MLVYGDRGAPLESKKRLNSDHVMTTPDHAGQTIMRDFERDWATGRLTKAGENDADADTVFSWFFPGQTPCQSSRARLLPI